MFLVPALLAGASDVLLLYLSSTYHGVVVVSSDETNDEHPPVILNTGYLVVLAIVRLVLLLVPLPYHSYTGTAVKYPIVYQLFYSCSIICMVGHMLAIIMLDPNSLPSFLPTSPVRYLPQHAETYPIMRHVWIWLTLSAWSTMLHCLLLWHVRSTAPAAAVLHNVQEKRQRVLYYYAQQQQQRDKSQEEDEEKPLVTERPNHHNNGNNGQHRNKLIPDGYDDFMLELQSRLRRAKQEWSFRLEDVTQRVSSLSTTTSTLHHGGGGHVHLTPTNSLFSPTTPFSVLLQLFAYQDVLKNEKLNRAFIYDDGMQMTFYVPQLLSFLLHGAFECSTELEEWILQKASQNVYFAHSCFWFLRAWCLEDAAHTHNNSLTPSASEGSLPQQQQQQQQHRRSYSNASSLGSWTDEEQGGGGLTCSGSSSLLLADSPPATTPYSRRPSKTKYDLEERTLIEGLMFRVMECGEIPARALDKYHDNHHHDVVDMPTLELKPQQQEEQQKHMPLIPVDSSNKNGSTASLSLGGEYGFMSLEHASASTTGASFMATPRFLDALTAMSDHLYLIPREKRLHMLRKQLRLIQEEYLPSTTTYLPVNNSHHRVWCIAADESIAISTKERVPCIVYFEVTDYDASQSQNGNNKEDGQVVPNGPCVKKASLPTSNKHAMSEREIILQWQHSRRDPQRHTTLLDKVTNFTHMNWKRFREQHGNDALFWINGDSNHWKDTMNNKPETLQEEYKDTSQEDVEFGLATGDEVSGEQGSSGMKPPLAPSSSRAHIDGIQVIEAPTTPLPLTSTDSSSQTSEMGQWSSPRGSPKKPLKSMPNDNVVDSLIGIRSSMERFNDRDSGSFTNESPLYSGGNSRGNQGAAGGEPRRSSSRKGSRPPPVVFKESFASQQERVRSVSAYGHLPGWRLLPILIKSNDDLRQEQLASQLIYRMASILSREKVPVWLCPYEIVALTDTGGVIEAIPDTISIDSLKRNSKGFTTLGKFFLDHFGEEGSDEYADAKACFVESLAAYSMVCFLLQIKDRHNGNILVDNCGHLIHIDFGFFFLSSPGKNSGFESAPFKLTRDFVDLMDGPDSKTFRTFRELCCRTFLALRRHCYQIILLVEMLMVGNENLPCFRGRPEDAVRGLRERFRLDLNDRACTEYVNALVDESLENWRTRWYDRYQRYCVGVL